MNKQDEYDIDETLDKAIPHGELDDLPEAPASATLKVWNQDNYGVLFTMRDTDSRKLYVRVNNFIKVLKADGWKADWLQNGSKVEHGPEWCPIHNVAMKKYTKEDRSWYSHKNGDAWCNGRS